MDQKKEVEEINGYYVASSLPKVFFRPPSIHFRPRENFREQKKKVNQKREQRKRGLEIRPHTVGDDKESLPVQGRQHLSIQTDLYLEEICDVVEEVDAQTETDPFLDRAPSPLFVPVELGVDVATQIYPGDLFDFDEKAEPLLEVLVQQTLEQAIIEIMAEEELAMLADSQKDLATKSSEELVELKRLEEEERRILEEKQRQLKEQEKAFTLEDEVAQKIAASIYSQNYLSELVPQVYEKLDAGGYFETEDPDSNDLIQDTTQNSVKKSSDSKDISNQDNVLDTAETSAFKPSELNSSPVGQRDKSDEISQ